MKVLESSEPNKIYRHEINESCLISLCSLDAAQVIVMHQEASESIDQLEVKIQDFFKKEPKGRLKFVGSKNWMLIVEQICDELNVTSQALLKVFPNSTQVMINASRGMFKVRRPEVESQGLGDRSFSVLVIDDSATMRKVLRKVIQSDPNLTVAAEAESAEEAFEKLDSFSPDVITLDIHLPGMDGVQFLHEMKNKGVSVPVIVITSLNLNDGDKVFEALQTGAIDYIQKPDMAELVKIQDNVCSKLKTAAKANVEVAEFNSGVKPLGFISFTESINANIPIFVGSSTGGTTAIERMLRQMAPPIPPIVIVQHIPSVFSKAFADRLNNTFSFQVKEAEDGDVVESNTVYIAPGGLQMGVSPVGSEGKLKLAIRDLPPVNRFKPSVDYLFESVSINYPGPKVALIMTGMGKDGANGMQSIKQAGNAITIAQDKSSSVVFGMPKAAIDLGSVDTICHLDEIPKKLRDSITQLKKSERKSA